MADLYYIESGYFDPELGYYVYTADAESAQTVSATLTAAVGVVKSAESSQLSEFTILATISHIEGVDIVVASFASLSADGVVTRDAASNQTSAFTQTTDSDRLRDFAVSLSDAFAFTVTADGGGVQNAEALLASEFTQTSAVNVVTDIISTQSSEFTQTTAGELFRDFTGNFEVVVEQTAIGGIIYEQSSAIDSAFSATMTVNIVVYNVASFEVSAMMTTDFVVNRSASMALENIANLDAQAARIAGLSAAFDSQATVSADISKTVDAESSISSTASLTAQISNTKQFASSITASAALSASARRLGRTPKTIDNFNNGGYLTNTNSKFGGYSFTEGDIRLANGTHGIELSAKDWVIDFWYDPGSRNNDLNLLRILTSSATQALNLDWNSSARALTLTINLISGAVTNLSASSANTTLSESGGWYHIRIEGQKVGSDYYYSLWINGSREIQLLNNYGVNMRSTLGQWTFGSNTTTDGFVDELLVKNDTYFTGYNVTTFTSPTSAWTNDSTTDLLVHFDNNLDDDAETTDRFGSATLTSAVTVSANVTKLVKASSTQSSAVTVTASAERARDSSAALSAEGFVVTVAGYRLDDLADLTSTTALIADVNITADAESTQNAETSLSAVGGYRKDFEFNVIVETSLEVPGQLVAGVSGSFTSEFTQTAESTRTRDITATLQAEGAVLTVAGFTVNQSAALSAETTLTADVEVTKEFSATMASAVTVTAQASLVPQIDVALNSAFTQTAQGNRIRFGASTQTASATLSIQDNYIFDAASTQTSAFAQTAIADVITDVGSSMVVGCSQTTLAVKTAVADSTESSVASLTTSVNVTTEAEADLAAAGFVITVVAKTGLGAADLNSAFSLTVTVNADFDADSSLSSAFTITAQPTRIKQYEGPTVSGVSNDTFRYVDDALNSGPSLTLGINGVVSFWARRSNTSNTTGGFVKSGQDIFNYINFDYVDNDVFRVTSNDTGGQLVASWQDAVPVDTDWHHYLYVIGTRQVPSPPFESKQFSHLYVDGIYLGQREATNTNLSIAMTSPVYFKSGRSELFTGGTGVYGPSDPFEGDFAQIWIGQRALNAPIDPTLFYNGGYVELGVDGTFGGLLPTPYVYDAMDEPFSSKLVPGAGESITPADVPLDSPDMVARFALSAEAQNILVTAANMPAVASLTANLTGSQFATAALTSAATQTATVRVTKPFNSNLSSAFALTANAGSTVKAEAQLSSTCTLTADVTAEKGAIVNAQSSFAVLAVTGFLGAGQANLTSTATLTVSADKIKDVFISVGSNCTTTASATKTAVAAFNQTAVFALHATPEYIRAVEINTLSDSGLTANTVVLRTAQANLSAQFTQTSNVGQIKGTSANLQVAGFVLTAGRVIHLDPGLTYQIPPESRIYKIHRETRVYSIPEETRIYKLRGY